MWKKLLNVVLIVVLVALIGGNDVLFGCCEDNDPESSKPFQPVTQTDKGGISSSNQLDSPTNEPESFGRIRRFLPKTKTDIFNAVLFGFIVVFGGLLFFSVISTSAKKGDIVERAEKLEESLQHPSEYKQEKVQMVAEMLCKPLHGSTESPPLNISAVTQDASTHHSTTQIDINQGYTTQIDTNQGNTTQIDINQGNTTQIDINQVNTTQIDTYQGNTTQVESDNVDTTQVPMETIAFTEEPNVDECKRIGIDIYDLLYPFAPNSYEATVAEFKLNRFNYETIKTRLSEANDYHCGSGFFRLVQNVDHGAIYFHGRNQFVIDAINDVTCQQAALKTFPLLEKLGQNVNVNFRHSYADKLIVYTHVHAAIKIADNKNCGNNFLTFGPDGNRLRVTYDVSNPHISKALLRYATEKTCRNVAYDVVLMLRSKGTIPTGVNAVKPMYDGYNFRNRLNSAKEVIADNDCGNGFFQINRPSSNDRTKVQWNNDNAYIIEAKIKVEANRPCLNAAISVVQHLEQIGIYSDATSGILVIPDIGDDIKLLIEKTRNAGSMDCGKKFFEVTKNDNEEFVLSFNYENDYVHMAMATVNNNDECRLTSRGVLRRLIDMGLHTTDSQNVIRITEPPSVIKELKGKIYRSRGLNCKAGDPTFTSDNTGITIRYQRSNKNIKSVEAHVRNEIWCPKGAYYYSYILDRSGHSMGDNSTSVSVTLSEKQKELVNTAKTQLNGVNCGSGFYNCDLTENEATFSWGSGNSHVEKAWTDARTNFLPLY